MHFTWLFLPCVAGIPMAFKHLLLKFHVPLSFINLNTSQAEELHIVILSHILAKKLNASIPCSSLETGKWEAFWVNACPLMPGHFIWSDFIWVVFLIWDLVIWRIWIFFVDCWTSRPNWYKVSSDVKWCISHPKYDNMTNIVVAKETSEPQRSHPKII